MQKRALIRVSLGTLIIGAAGSACFVAGCGDDDDLPVTAADSGLTDQAVVPPTDTGVSDTNVPKPDTGVDAGPPRAKVILVHATPGFGALRVCFKIGKAADGSDGVISPTTAQPDVIRGAQPYPGVFPGTGGPFPDTGLDLAPFALTPIVIRAEKISTEVKTDGGTQKSCQDLLGASSTLVANTDYVQFPTFPVGTFVPGATLLLALTGCQAGDTGGAAKCGAGYTTANSNFTIQKFLLDRAPVPATKLGAQFINLTPAVEGQGATAFAVPCGLDTNCTGNGVYPVLVKPDPADAAAPPTVKSITTSPVKFPELKPATAAQLDNIVAATDRFGFAGANTAVGGDGGRGTIIGQAPLTLVQTATVGSATQTDYFRNGQAYTFVMIGAPSDGAQPTDGGFNGYAIHFLGFNNDPVLPPK
jgi:hypothetical protein